MDPSALGGAGRVRFAYDPLPPPHPLPPLPPHPQFLSPFFLSRRRTMKVIWRCLVVDTSETACRGASSVTSHPSLLSPRQVRSSCRKLSIVRSLILRVATAKPSGKELKRMLIDVTADFLHGFSATPNVIQRNPATLSQGPKKHSNNACQGQT